MNARLISGRCEIYNSLMPYDHISHNINSIGVNLSINKILITSNGQIKLYRVVHILCLIFILFNSHESIRETIYV